MLTVERIYDEDTYRSVICHPEIFPRVADESQDSENVIIPGDKFVLAGSVNGKCIGITTYDRFHIDSLQAHFAVLPKYRRHAYRFGKKSLEWAWQNIPRACIVAIIPDKFENTIKFARYCGMETVGHIPKASIFDGRFYGISMLSINNPNIEVTHGRGD